MKSVKLLCGCALLAFLATSCLSQQSLSTNQNQTQVVLSQANYRIIGTATGTAKGATADKLVVNSAFKKMVEDANLTGSQALININYERIRTHSHKQVVVVTGTIIEFIK